MSLEELNEKIGKLPQWAQRYVAKLRQDVEYYKTQLHKVEAGDTAIRWDLYLEDTGGNIPDRARVLFTLNGGTLECVIREGVLSVRGRGSEQPVVRPDARNMINISAE